MACPCHDLVFVTPLLPLLKIARNTRPLSSKLGGTTLNGGEEEVSVIADRFLTSSDLK